MQANTSSEYSENGGAIHLSAELDNPGTGGPVDTHDEKILARKPGLMEKLDAKVSKKIEISQGTAWLLGALVVLANLAFNYGGSLWGFAKDSQKQSDALEKIEIKMEARNAVFEEQLKGIIASQGRQENNQSDFSKRLREQELFNAKLAPFLAKQNIEQESK